MCPHARWPVFAGGFHVVPPTIRHVGHCRVHRCLHECWCGTDRRQGSSQHAGTTTVNVAGSAVDDLKNAIVHWTKPTATGMVQQSTETVELTGDLKGRVLYHVTSTFDFVNGTLVNTGDQVFSGTIAGSAPVLIHDDQFRFQVNLITGNESGQVYLFNHLAGPKVRCRLEVVGTGLNADGNPTADYSGECTVRGQ
jgi:hypothetical protein